MSSVAAHLTAFSSITKSADVTILRGDVSEKPSDGEAFIEAEYEDCVVYLQMEVDGVALEYCFLYLNYQCCFRILTT